MVVFCNNIKKTQMAEGLFLQTVIDKDQKHDICDLGEGFS